MGKAIKGRSKIATHALKQKQDYNTLFFYSSGESNLTILSNNLFRNGRLTKYATSSTRMLLDSSFR